MGSFPDNTASDSPAFELSARQAELAFERTLMSLDQSLLGAIRTSLSMIGFGFAMVLFFHQLSGQIGVDLKIPVRNFGISLVAMGVGLITVALIGHRRRFVTLRASMNDLHGRGLLLQRFPYKWAPIAIFAQLLLLAGLLVALGLVVRMGPFQDTPGARPPAPVVCDPATTLPGR